MTIPAQARLALILGHTTVYGKIRTVHGELNYFSVSTKEVILNGWEAVLRAYQATPVKRYRTSIPEHAFVLR